MINHSAHTPNTPPPPPLSPSRLLLPGECFRGTGNRDYYVGLLYRHCLDEKAIGRIHVRNQIRLKFSSVAIEFFAGISYGCPAVLPAIFLGARVAQDRSGDLHRGWLSDGK